VSVALAPADPLVALAARGFNYLLDDMAGAYFVDLYDVTDPVMIVSRAITNACLTLDVKPIKGQPYLRLLNLVVATYEEQFVIGI
jgi:hypothetical protein